MKHIVIAGMLLAAAVTARANPPFSPPIPCCGYGDSLNMGEASMAVHGANISVICNLNERGTYPMIPIGRSTDYGATWLPTIPWKDAQAPSTWHTDPFMVYDEQGNFHMFVQYSTVVLRHYLSTDNGNTWIDSVDVSDRTTTGQVDKDWGAYDQGVFHMFWQEISGPEQGIRHSRSTDGGYTWNVTTIVPGGSGIAAPAVDPNGVIYLVYGWSSLYFMKSADQGLNWTSPTFLNNVTYSTGYGDRAPLPSLAAPANGVLFLTWTDNRSGNWDVKYRRSTDGGANWTALANLNDSTAGGQFKCWVTSDPYGGLHAFYYHTPSWPTSSSSRFSMRYHYSPDGGATIQPSVRLSDTTFTSPVTFLGGDYQTLACDSQRVHCIWGQNRNGHLELFYSYAELSQLGVDRDRRPRAQEPVLLAPTVFRGKADLIVNLNQARPVRLDVFDASGRIVKSLYQGRLPAGRSAIAVSGLPLNRPLFIRLSAGQEYVRKVIAVP
jgi:hypothetical protein